MAKNIFLPYERDGARAKEEAEAPEPELTAKQADLLAQLRGLLDTVCNADETTVPALARENGARFVILMREAIAVKLPRQYLEDLSARMKSAMQ